MHRPVIAALASLALLSCSGEKPLTLPENGIDRAATCGVVAAAEARVATDVREVLPFEAQGRILHPALIVASESGSFSGETANQVSVRMTELAEAIADGKWQDLVPTCRAAYPPIAKTEFDFPRSAFDARLGCNELADFVMTALQEQESDYVNELAEYRDLKQALENSLVAGLRGRAGSDREAQQAERRKALAAFATLGPPNLVLRQCIQRYG